MVRKKSIKPVQYVWAYLRISLGLIFLWAFFDKLLGLGMTTCKDKVEGTVEYMCDSAWINNWDSTPVDGFLKFGTTGPFSDIYQSLAGNTLVAWIFMLGLLGIGTGLALGIAMRISVISGIAMMVLMWAAVLPPEHHPFLDDHLIYAGVLLGLWYVNDDQVLGYGKGWAKTSLVKQYPILK